jgi:cellulose synthase/poly-beta-1,6-N-acetylglucosamine synthase-like glycosyltransferase
MARLVVRGKYLFDGDRKFLARGVSYGPFSPNSRGERYPEPERAAADFALMRELGANLLRLYVAPPPWLVEEAGKAGLRLMIGFPWPFHMAFLESRQMTRDIRETIRNGVSEMRRFGDAIFAYSIGNEIRSDIVRWHGPRAVSRFLAELYDAGKQLDPDALFTYSNYPSAEYLDLSFLDIVSFNVYLHREGDYRRYLTHLLAGTGDRPLVLSETGMDTIRDGEDHQAELLGWQARAAFELGLSGFVVFAFTDEWHTGGAEITDWAFGITTRDRRPKKAYQTLSAIFSGELPPPLAAAPKASVVVAAYNAAGTIGECLQSLRELNYPDYEVIVVDDGSTDSTAAIAEKAGVELVRVDHRGLSGARNAGIDAATGQLVAFIDSDARADRDWLYHLAETVVRRDAAAAGGGNFAPPSSTAIAAAMAAAPGLPREVRAADDRLAQICGCNMAVSKAALGAVGRFDPVFTAAGDDVDLSWRLAQSGGLLAAAPGATVIHERRATLAAYLAQQRGYGAGEGLLWKRYPLRRGIDGAMYGGQSWWESLLGGPRVYYGAFGRGLFQTIYPAGASSLLISMPLTIYWVGAAIVFLIAGAVSRFFGVLGAVGISLTLIAAALAALQSPVERRFSGPVARAWLWLVNLAGPIARSIAREAVRWRIEPGAADGIIGGRFELAGTLEFAPGEGAGAIDHQRLLDSMRRALLRRTVAVATTDGFQSYDLQMIVMPAIRVALNALRQSGGRVALRWRIGAAAARVAAAAAGALILLLAAGLGLWVAILADLLGALVVGGLAWRRARRLPSILRAAARDAAFELSASAADADDEAAA